MTDNLVGWNQKVVFADGTPLSASDSEHMHVWYTRTSRLIQIEQRHSTPTKRRNDARQRLAILIQAAAKGLRAGRQTAAFLARSCIYRFVQLLYRLRSQTCGFIATNSSA